MKCGKCGMRLLVAGAIWCAAVAAGGNVVAPTKAASPLTPAQSNLLREGMVMSGAGDYAGALAKYEAVLRENPHAVQVLAEASLALSASKDYGRALSYALRGAEYRSPWLGKLYALAGECYAQTSRGSEAVDLFQAAIASEPDNFTTYYEFGVTLMTLGRLDEAREALKASIALKPDYPLSHYALGMTELTQGAKVPAMLALFRYLVLDPNSDRSGEALTRVSQILDGIGAGEVQQPGPTVETAKAPLEAEGDFAAAVGAASMAWKAALEEKRVGSWDRVVLTLGALFERLGQEDEGWRDTFTGKFYVPYFAKISAQKLVEPFCAVVFQGGGHEVVTSYFQSNPEKITAFQKWTEDYPWPKLKVALAPPKKAAPGKGSHKTGAHKG